MNLATKDDDAQADATYWQRLLHRWLVQYNPLYLLSATLCIVGMVLCSRGLARGTNVYAPLAVAAIAELYAVALIAGAALLTRIGQRRPAVLLALVTALYQCDLTLHTEACAWLGTLGVIAGGGWLVLFVVKLYALAWALRLRIPIFAGLLAAGGALGVAVLPHLLRELPIRSVTALVSAWLFGLFIAARYGSRSITSKEDLDDWGRTVLRRGLRAVWLLWSVLMVLHVAFWSTGSRLGLETLWPVPVLLGIAWVRREGYVWAIVATALALTRSLVPANFAIVALLAAVALGARALWLREAAPPAPREQEPSRSPYRMGESERPVFAASLNAPPTFVRPSLASRRRLVTGALFGVYLAAWTLHWAGGAWPAHLIALDVLLTVVVVVAVARARLRPALVPLAASYVHFALQAQLASAPRSAVSWGIASVASGFVLLLASLAASYFLRNVEPPARAE